MEADPSSGQDLDGAPLRGPLLLVAASAVLVTASLILVFVPVGPRVLSPTLALAAVFGGTAPIALSFVRELQERRFGVDGLVVIAVAVTAYLGEFAAAAIVALMLNAGELLENWISRRSRRSLRALLKGVPQTARVLEGGEELEVRADRVVPGATVVVRTGDRLPVDGTVRAGRASLDEAALTGEPFPVPKAPGDGVRSGAVVETGYLRYEATSSARDSTYARIVRLVEEGLARRAPIERLADRYARWFAPVIFLLALGTWWFTGDLLRAAAVLVVVCPCALVLATPTAVAAALGRSAKRGVLVKGGDVLERTAKVGTVLFDKTGTLTLGRPRVVGVNPEPGVDAREMLAMAASAELYSEHALGRALVREARERDLALQEPDTFEVLPGRGVVAEVGEAGVTVGSAELIRRETTAGLTPPVLPDGGAPGTTDVFVARDGVLLGVVSLEDTPRRGLEAAMEALRRAGVRRVGLLSGDKADAAKRVAALAGVSEVQGNLLPEDKARIVQVLRDRGETVLMAGDGVNDAPALATADIGVAMGDTATDASLEVADVALLEPDLEKVAWLLARARKTTRLIRQNIALGLALSAAGTVLAFLGWISPLGAAALHEGNALVVILNSARLAFGP